MAVIKTVKLDITFIKVPEKNSLFLPYGGTFKDYQILSQKINDICPDGYIFHNQHELLEKIYDQGSFIRKAHKDSITKPISSQYIEDSKEFHQKEMDKYKKSRENVNLRSYYHEDIRKYNEAVEAYNSQKYYLIYDLYDIPTEDLPSFQFPTKTEREYMTIGGIHGLYEYEREMTYNERKSHYTGTMSYMKKHKLHPNYSDDGPSEAERLSAVMQYERQKLEEKLSGKDYAYETKQELIKMSNEQYCEISALESRKRREEEKYNKRIKNEVDIHFIKIGCKVNKIKFKEFLKPELDIFIKDPMHTEFIPEYRFLIVKLLTLNYKTNNKILKYLRNVLSEYGLKILSIPKKKPSKFPFF